MNGERLIKHKYMYLMERNDALEQHLLTAVQKLCCLANMLVIYDWTENRTGNKAGA